VAMAKARRLRMGHFLYLFKLFPDLTNFLKIHGDPLENLGDHCEGLADRWEGMADRWEGLGDA
jgi:hypothetical protein